MLIDREDYYKHIYPEIPRTKSGYAYLYKYPKRSISISRLILGLEPGDGLCADHINRVKLDNRKINLRVVTKTENGQNKSKYKNGKSRYRGVRRSGNRWQAYACLGGKQFHLGSFKTEIEAALAVDSWRDENMLLATDRNLPRASYDRSSPGKTAGSLSYEL